MVSDCKYHVFLVPKYRCRVFGGEVRKAVREEIRKLCTWMRIEILEGHVSKDHVHICLAIPPKYAVSDVIGTLKGKTAIGMFNKFPELRKRYWGSHFWSRGHYANTVGKDEAMIREHIKNQDKLDRLENQGRLPLQQKSFQGVIIPPPPVGSVDFKRFCQGIAELGLAAC